MQTKKWEIQVVVLCLCLGVGSACSARVKYVDSNAPAMGEGSSWAEAYNYLQDALDNASPGTEIRVAKGIYRPGESRYANDSGDKGNREASFELINDVTLKGGYAGLGEPDPNERDVGLYETILSGDLNGDDDGGLGNYNENSYHVVTGSNTDETAVLDGFTITAGNADGDYFSFQDVGPGMFNYAGSPTVLNCAFIRNSLYNGNMGGGICNYDNSGPTLRNCTFNMSGISNYFSGPTLINCTFSGSGMGNFTSSPTLTSCTFSSGGGMSNHSRSNPTLTNCTFTGNRTEDNGGGMVNNSSSPVLTGCTFRENQSDNYGGGMFNNNSSPILTNCIFIGNRSEHCGGGMSNSEGSNPVLRSCTFSNNVADDQGGGMYSNGDDGECYPQLTNCTFSENTAVEGGGMFNTESSPTLTDCTFNDNSADYGAGTFNYDVRLVLTDCAFNDNSALLGAGMFNRGVDLIVRNCTFSGNMAEGGTETYEGGGGMCNIRCVITVSNSVFTDNTSIEGGGMANYGQYGHGSVTLNNCTFRNNAASDNGGGIMNHYVYSLEMTGCVFSGNSAEDSGGGMRNFETVSTIIGCTFIENSAPDGGAMQFENEYGSTLANCIFAGNRAENGGAIWAEDEDVTMTNCTFSGNMAGNSSSAGGIFMDERLELANCIFWMNVAGDTMNEAAQIQVRHSIRTTIDYSCVQGWSGDLGGIGNIGDDPCFVDPGYWDPKGTPEDFTDDFWVNGDYHLLWASPCIDAGDPNFLDDPNECDIDGEPRVMAGRVDIGVDEVGPKQADLSRDGLINFEDYSILIQSFGSGTGDPNWYVLSNLFEDESIDYNDLALLIDDWLWEAAWHK